MPRYKKEDDRFSCKKWLDTNEDLEHRKGNCMNETQVINCHQMCIKIWTELGRGKKRKKKKKKKLTMEGSVDKCSEV